MKESAILRLVNVRCRGLELCAIKGMVKVSVRIILVESVGVIWPHFRPLGVDDHQVHGQEKQLCVIAEISSVLTTGLLQ